MGFLFGVSYSFISVNLVSYIQSHVDNKFRGRVFGTFGLLENIGMPIALGGIGLLVDYISISWIFVINFFILVLAASIWYKVSLSSKKPLLSNVEE